MIPPGFQDEHAEQLRGLAQLSSLIASFGIIAFIQFGFEPTEQPLGLLIIFSISNALTVGTRLPSSWY